MQQIYVREKYVMAYKNSGEVLSKLKDIGPPGDKFVHL